MKLLFFLVPFISKIKTADILNFLSVKYFDKGLLFLKIWHIRNNYCRYRLGHLNNRQKKNSRKFDNTFVWKLAAKKVFGESFKFFDPPNTKWRSLKFLAKLNGNHILMTNFSKFCKYQTFGLIELHNLSKSQLADRIFKSWKSCVYNYRALEHTTF